MRTRMTKLTLILTSAAMAMVLAACSNSDVEVMKLDSGFGWEAAEAVEAKVSASVEDPYWRQSRQEEPAINTAEKVVTTEGNYIFAASYNEETEYTTVYFSDDRGKSYSCFNATDLLPDGYGACIEASQVTINPEYDIITVQWCWAQGGPMMTVSYNMALEIRGVTME